MLEYVFYLDQRTLAWLPVPVLFLAIVAFWVTDPKATRTSPIPGHQGPASSISTPPPRARQARE